MEKYILLKKDKSVETLKVDKRLPLNECSYILVPIMEFDVGTFVAFEPDKIWNKISKVVITFEMAIIKADGENEKALSIQICNSLNKECYSLYDTVNYLHSLNRLFYINTFCYGNEFGEYTNIEFTKFQITAFDKKDILYEYSFDGKSDKKKSPEDILKKIKLFYNPTFPMDTDYLYISNNKWDIKKNIKNVNAIYGVGLPDTKSIIFLEYQILTLFQNIKSLFSGSYLYNKVLFTPDYTTEEIVTQYDDCISGTLPMEVCFRYYDTILVHTTHILEYIIYIKTMYHNMVVITEFENFNSFTNAIIMKTWIELESVNPDITVIGFEFDVDSIISMQSIGKKIYDKWVIH